MVNVAVPCVVRRPRFATAPNKFVLDAVDANEVVVVAFVEVELSAVKFWRVVEPETNIEPRFSKSAPVVVVAEPPNTTAVAPAGEMARPFVEVAHLENERVESPDGVT